MSSVNEQPATDSAHKAGAFDIRVFIASLIGLYGLVLVVVGLVDTDEAELTKAAGLNINLYAGIGMAVVAALFLLWAKLRPVVVADAHGDEDDPGDENDRAGH